MAGSWRRGGAGVVAAAMAVTAVVAWAEVAAAAPWPGLPAGVEDLEPWVPGDDPTPPPWVEPESAPEITSDSVEPMQFAFPEPSASEVALGDPGELVDVAEAPVAMASGSAAVEGTGLQVRVLDQAAAARAGVAGFVFEVSGLSDPVAELGGQGGLPVDLAVDYSSFAHAYGGGYADRLQVVALPACAVAPLELPDCHSGGVVLPTHNDPIAQTLTVDVSDLGALSSAESSGLVVAADATPDPLAEELATGSPATATAEMFSLDDLLAVESTGTASSEAAVLAVTSGTSGETGNPEATPLSIAADWQVATGSGEFSWTYDMAVPKPPYGTAPSVALSYSSGAVDGMVSAKNTQSPMTGVGWSDFANAFIERRYAPCAEEKTSLEGLGDLCWKSWNATISLNGRSSELVWMGDAAHATWRLKDDPNWRVELLHRGVPNGDNDNEFWRVTTPDGTVYDFGLNTNLETGDVTNSLWSVPVFADDATDPCSDTGACDQAWRWNLDRVQDPDGIVTVYYYDLDVNHYKAINGLGNHAQPYVRGGRLARIEYARPHITYDGTADDVFPAGQVVFTSQYRCNDLNDQCPTPSAATAARYPDVPTDLLCGAGADCGPIAPTFFGAHRYTAVLTQVRHGGQWKNVDLWGLTHQFIENSDGDSKLYLKAIQRAGGSDGGLFLLPEVSFLPTAEMPNRVDTASGKTMGHRRVAAIQDEVGGSLLVTYGQKDPCSANKAGPWDTNIEDCFPQRVKDKWGVFHKYLTLKVQQIDGTGGSPAATTSYVYEDTAAWHHDDDEFVKASNQSWSNWRGYSTTVVVDGTSVANGDPATRYRVFRGLYGDRGSTRPTPAYQASSWATSTSGGVPPAVEDLNWLAGRVFEETTLGSLGRVEQGVMHHYASAGTAIVGTDSQDYAHWVAEDQITTASITSQGGYEQQRTTTYYLGLKPERVYEEGWMDQPGDERCTRTKYAADPGESRWMLTYPYEVIGYRGECPAYDGLPTSDPHYPQDSTNPAVIAREFTHVETYYDNSPTAKDLPTGAGPKGNPTKIRSKIDATRWAEATTTYEQMYGRVTQSKDANGLIIDTAYEATPSGGYPGQSWTTTHLGASSADWPRVTTDWLPQRGVPTKVEDANHKITTYDYDDLGRLLSVRLPNEQAIAPKNSIEYAYLISTDKSSPPVISTRQLQATGSPDRWEQSWIVYDSLRRERQTQVLSRTSGKVLVTTTNYDNHGRVAATLGAQAVTGVAGQAVLAPGSGGWDNKTTTTYDQAGRIVEQGIYSKDSSGSLVQQYTTTNSFYVDTTDPAAFLHVTKTHTNQTSGPETTTGLDGLGRTTTVKENDTTNEPAPGDGTGWRATTYGYDLADNLLTVTDSANNTITYTYDNMMGWRTAMHDPDAGNWTYTYNAAGLQTSVKDAKDQTIWTNYDLAGRPINRRRDNPTTGALLAEWKYDAPAANQQPSEKGLLDKTVRYTSVGVWETDITGYDLNDRPTGTALKVPTGLPGLTGSPANTYTYTTTVKQDRADHLLENSYPAVGGLPAEKVTTTYDTLGLQVGMNSDIIGNNYVRATSYDDRNRPSQLDLGPQASGAMSKTWTYNRDQRIDTANTVTGGSAISHGLGYDKLGYITSRTTTLATQSWRECYEHDSRQRLTAAYTVTTNAACDGTNKGTGSQPYNQTYSHSADGNLTRRTDGGPTLTDFIYPTPGATSVRPHAPTTAGSGQYEWDPNGHLTKRTIGTSISTFTWDIERQLTSVTTPNGAESYIYDADGQRILRITPSGRTLYFAGQEITATFDGSTVTGIRTYTFAGQTIATRKSNQPAKYIVSDQQGSIEAAAPHTSAPDATVVYDPYGRKRGATGTIDTDRGWLNQIEDDTTGLNYLNARYYDPNLAHFISPDPLYTPNAPKSLNPYTYAWSNPVTNSDPSGLVILECTTGEIDCAPDSTGAPAPVPGQSGSGGGSTNGSTNTSSGGGSNGGQSQVPDHIDPEPKPALLCFICWLLTPFHNRAAQLVQQHVPTLSTECVLSGRGRPDLCERTPAGLVLSYGEVKYESAWSINKGIGQLRRYAAEAGAQALPGGPSVGWPSGPLTETYSVGAGSVTLSVRYNSPGLYTYKVSADGDLRWVPALFEARSEVEARAKAPVPNSGGVAVELPDIQPGFEAPPVLPGWIAGAAIACLLFCNPVTPAPFPL